MEQLTKSRPAILLVLALLFLILLAVYMLGVRPLSERTEQYDQNISQMQQEYDLLHQKLIELKGHAADQAVLDQAVPMQDQSEQLLLSLQQIGQKSNARLTDVAFALKGSETEQAAATNTQQLSINAGQIQMSAQVEGSYTEIKNWLNELQKLPRLINVDSFSFDEPYNPGKAAAPITAKIVFTAYYTQ
ncbi:type 4a pilus biogenesis protein PilO [Paenibacillus bovis]|uniref:Uncharacterized protein n=1 Tax=Paenibacillus bovis TaxID=1616788 RepID=A0A172ZDK3_9BACL|nr:type 4a pilus biogenesis protein PilO [Paenibacillus bovis]ANF95744.1 hypothetical protein AR543_06830 [Paenibacillus bovis]